MFLPWRCLRWEHRRQRYNLTKRLGDRILKEQTKRVEVALSLVAGDFAMNQQLVLLRIEWLKTATELKDTR